MTTGARPGEALIIRSCDLNTSGCVWEYRPETHKTEHHEKDRIVFIGPAGQALLREYLTTDLQAYLFQPRDAVSAMLRKRCRPDARLRRDLGDRYSLHSYSSAIRRACIKAGVQHWSANQLRHSFATRARREAGIEAARVTLGHSSAVTTEIYAEVDHAKARELVLRIG